MIQLPEGWGRAEIQPSGPRIPCAAAPMPRAYDHLGNCLSWFPPAAGRGRFACDLEDSRRDVSFLSARLGIEPAQFHGRWVASEVLAKLADVPILKWLKLRGCFPCEPGVPARAEIAAPSGPVVAELLVVPDGPRMMAFGFIR